MICNMHEMDSSGSPLSATPDYKTWQVILFESFQRYVIIVLQLIKEKLEFQTHELFLSAGPYVREAFRFLEIQPVSLWFLY